MMQKIEWPNQVKDGYDQLRNVCRKMRKQERPKPEKMPADFDNKNYAVDFVKFGFKKAFLQLSYVYRFILRLRHRVHDRKGLKTLESCKICNVLTAFKTGGLDKLIQKQEGRAEIDGPPRQQTCACQ